MMTNPVRRITQGQFSYLPALTDAEIALQIQYGLNKGYAWSVEYTDDPHPRNTYWEMFGNPMFDIRDAAGILGELQSCRKAFPQHYIKVNAFDSSHGRESLRLSFIVNRPDKEPGFSLERREVGGRNLQYTTNLAIPLSSYTLSSVPNPQVPGDTLPIYNADRTLFGGINELDTTSTDNTRVFKGVDVSLNLRIPGTVPTTTELLAFISLETSTAPARSSRARNRDS